MTNRKCLKDVTLTLYLEGSLSAGERGEAEAHLVACDSCRRQLADFMRLLDDEVQEEEDRILRQAMEQWTPVGPAETKRSLRPGWWVASAAVLLAAFAGFLYYRTEPAVPAFHEAVALSVLNQPTRSLEARLSVYLSPESYRPFVALRSGVDSPTDLPDLSPDASAGAGSHARGIFFLARREFDEAVPLLEQAIIEAETPAARNDLGVAYMERTWASQAEQERYRELAATQFEIAIRLDERFAPARFNLVLWYERDSQEEAFRAEAAAYLGLDPSSGWAEEIRAIGE